MPTHSRPAQANHVISMVSTDGQTDLELCADTRRFLLLVEVQQGLGDAVGQRQVAEVLQGLDVE